jgi:predicted AlkP superfamily phosphohydrolase/phosphomutase
MRRALVIAIDGATLDLIGPWAQEGQLPHLARLIQRGAHGHLQSTIPPITGAAWSTFQTGVNPGKHGVFDWLTRQAKSYQLVPISSRSIRRQVLWEYLSAQGLRVGVIGVPVSYPARAINGFMLTDLLTPEGEDYAFPPGLRSEIEARVGRYPVMPDHWRGRHAAARWLRNLKASLAQRMKIARYLLEHWPWDFLMVHIMETDSVQHQMWHLLDGEERAVYRAHGVSGNPILEIYQQADAAIGELIESAPDATVFVLSDHGFGPLHYNIHLNCWLLHHGYLRLRRNPATLIKHLGFQLGLTAHRLNYLAEELRQLERGARLRHIEVHRLFGRVFLSMQNIDWEQTRAYSYGNVGQVFLNLRGREPQGCVARREAEALLNQIAHELQELKNPLNGERAIARVYRKEEIYHGDHLDRAADLILAPADHYMAIGTSEFLANREITPAYAGSGWHRMEGVFIAAGEAIRRGSISHLSIVDMFPTLVCAMGLLPPPGLDGKACTAIFTKEFLADLSQTLAAVPGQPLQIASGPDPEPNDRRDQEIRDRLRALGYI